VSEPENADIAAQLDGRMVSMLDAVEKSQDAKAIAAAFRTLVEYSKSKPAQKIEGAGFSVTISSVAGPAKE
jgi:hypothetical protein